MKSIYEIYYGSQLKVYVYNPTSDAGLLAAAVVKGQGHCLVDNPKDSDLALAPLLNQKLAREEYLSPRHGTLIFHPSLLPRHRGPDAIKWAYRNEENFTGVTWFWCFDGYDTGEICEQEVLPLNRNIRPSEFYALEVLPAMIRTLKRILEDIARGFIRRVPQYEPAATYEKKIVKVQNG